MSTPDRRETPEQKRLHGSDRSGLGNKGWSETPDDLAGDPDDSNIDGELYDPLQSPAQRDISRAMAGALRRERIHADRA